MEEGGAMELEPNPILFGKEWEESWKAILNKDAAVRLARYFWPEEWLAQPVPNSP